MVHLELRQAFILGLKRQKRIVSAPPSTPSQKKEVKCRTKSVKLNEIK
jgi:hypothetical protein